MNMTKKSYYRLWVSTRDGVLMLDKVYEDEKTAAEAAYNLKLKPVFVGRHKTKRSKIVQEIVRIYVARELTTEQEKHDEERTY